MLPGLRISNGSALAELALKKLDEGAYPGDVLPAGWQQRRQRLRVVVMAFFEKRNELPGRQRSPPQKISQANDADACDGQFEQDVRAV